MEVLSDRATAVSTTSMSPDQDLGCHQQKLTELAHNSFSEH